MENFSKICNYEDFKVISVVNKGVYTTSLIQDPFSGTRYIKKELSKEKLPIYQKLQNLKHQSLADIIAVIEKDHAIIVIIEYATGETLKSILDKKIKLDEKIAISYIQQLTSVLNVIHQNGIIHRDITPSNIIVATNGEVKLIDFDIARFYKYSQTEDTQLLGTPGYAAPEQFGFDQSTASSDIYALGILLNVMITGMKPNEIQVKNEDLALIIKNCTSMDKSLRYQDVMQLDYDLRRLKHVIINDFSKKSSEKTIMPSKIATILGFLLLISIGYIIFQVLQSSQDLNVPNANEPESSLSGQEQSPTVPNDLQRTTTGFELPVILESGFMVSQIIDTFLFYGLILKNPNENFAIDGLYIRVTARAADDTILGTGEIPFARIYPNQIVAAAGPAFPIDEAPATVDFEVLSPGTQQWVHESLLDPFMPLTVDNISRFEEGVFTGEISNDNDYDIDHVSIVIIFRDENDQIVGGNFIHSRHLPANGTLPFTFDIWYDSVTPNYEIHARRVQ